MITLSKILTITVLLFGLSLHAADKNPIEYITANEKTITYVNKSIINQNEWAKRVISVTKEEDPKITDQIYLKKVNTMIGPDGEKVPWIETYVLYKND